MPIQRSLLSSCLLAALAGGGLSLTALPLQAQETASTAVPVRDAAVLSRLGEVGSYLRSLKQFTVLAEATTDEVLGTGQKIQFASKVEYQVGGPNLLRASLRSDRRLRDFYFDGKTLTQVAPRAGYYASVPMEGTIAQLLGTLAERFEIEIPLADLFFWGTPKSGLEDVTAATLIGPARIGGVDSEHFALRQAGVDWQIWVMRGDKPLPVKLVITTTDEPSQPQYAATLHWDLKAKPPLQTFSYTPAKGMNRIVMKPVSDAATTN